MGVLAVKDYNQGGNDKYVFLNSSGSVLQDPITGSSSTGNLSARNVVDPINEICYVPDLDNYGKLNKIDMNTGELLDILDYSIGSDFYFDSAYQTPEPYTLTAGGWILGRSTTAGERDNPATGSFYAIKNDFSEVYFYNLNIPGNILDIKMSYDRAHIFIAASGSGIGSKIWKYPVSTLVTGSMLFATFQANATWEASPTFKAIWVHPPAVRDIDAGESDLIISGYGTWDIDCYTARLSDDGTTEVWKIGRGFGLTVADAEYDRVYFGNGYNDVLDTTIAVAATYASGAAVDTEAHSPSPFKVRGAVMFHDTDMIAFGGYLGSGVVKVYGVDGFRTGGVPQFEQQWSHVVQDSNISRELQVGFGDQTGYYSFMYDGGSEPNWVDPGGAPTGNGTTYGYYTPILTVTNPGTGNRLNVAWSGSVAVTGSLGMAPVKGFRLYCKPTNTIGGPYDPTARLIASYTGSQSVSGSFTDTSIYNHQSYYYAGFYLYDTTQAASGSVMYEAPYGSLYMGTGSGTPTDVVPPDMVSGFTTTAQGVVAGPDPNSGEGAVRLAWTNPTGSYFTGAVVLRQGVFPNAAVAFAPPVDETHYVKGQTIGDSTVIYSRANLVEGASVVYLDTDLSPKYQYHYAVYAHDRNFFYTSGSVVSPGVL